MVPLTVQLYFSNSIHCLGDNAVVFFFFFKPTSEKSHDIQLVALHSYKSSNPEDLNFVQGDTITLLSRGEDQPMSLTPLRCESTYTCSFMSFCLVNQDWLEGQCSGHTGIFPASFVEEITTKWVFPGQVHQQKNKKFVFFSLPYFFFYCRITIKKLKFTSTGAHFL